MDFLNGDLDNVFSVLYEMGKIEPMLNKDWKHLYQLNHDRWEQVSSIISGLNRLNCKNEIRGYLETLAEEMIEALVVEVARELAAFYDKARIIH